MTLDRDHAARSLGTYCHFPFDSPFTLMLFPTFITVPVEPKPHLSQLKKTADDSAVLKYLIGLFIIFLLFIGPLKWLIAL